MELGEGKPPIKMVRRKKRVRCTGGVAILVVINLTVISVCHISPFYFMHILFFVTFFSGKLGKKVGPSKLGDRKFSTETGGTKEM